MSSEITLRKALQVKKNIIGEIVKLKENAEKYNSQQKANKHVNVQEIFAELHRKIDQLIALKTAISKANVNIYEAIVHVEEIKSLISMYDGLNVQEEYQSYVMVDGKNNLVTSEGILFIDLSKKEETLKDLKKQLEEHLEKIDYFNSVTKITVDID